MLDNLHLLHPAWLWALAPLGILILILGRSRAGAGDWARVVDPHLLPHLLVGRHEATRRWPLILLAMGWILAVIALANPVFEKQASPLYRSQSARVIVLDLSRSMQTPDLKPSRMARARFEVADILARSEEGQVGLVVFAGDAFTVSPLTDDTATIRALLSTLEPDLMPAQGSRADLGLLKAGELLHQAGRLRGDILLIADAADQQAQAAAERLHEQGYRVSAMAVGTEEGAPLPDGRGGFVRDREGKIVTPRLELDLFRELARAGGGSFSPILGGDADIDRLLADTAPGLEETAEAAEHDTELWKENGPWLALLLLPLGALAFRRGWLLGLTFLMAGNLYAPAPAQAFTWEDLWQRRDQQAAQALARGDHAGAVAKAQTPDRLGTALFRAGEFDKAADAFAQTPSVDGHYNRGNALARQGRLQEAVSAYDQALASSPDMADALYNKQQVEKLLQKQSPSRQQQQEGSSSDAQNQADEQAQDQQQSGQTPQDPGQADTRQQDGQEEQRPADASAAQQPEDNPPEADDQPKETANAGQDDPEQARQALTSAMEENADADADAKETTEREGSDQPLTDEEHLDGEERQVVEQWLRRIPDDPGGLLRRKFRYQYVRRAPARSTEDADPW